MSEPKTKASELCEIVAGILHWTIHDERIDFRSEAYALMTPAGAVVIDPLPLTDEAFRTLGSISAIYLTGAFHQRAAWSFRERCGAPILVPQGAVRLDGEPDGHYAADEEIVEDLVALDRPGPTSPHFVLALKNAEGTTLFSGDLLVRSDDGPFSFAGDEHHADPAGTRASVRHLLDRPVDRLCPSHGPPALSDGSARIREALDLDAR